MREELQKFSSNNNAIDNKALHSIRSCTHWSHLKELSTLIKFLITSLALTDLLVEVVLTFSIVRRMKRARGLDWTWIPLSSLSLKLTCLVSKLAEYWSGEGRASMGVGCTWEISVPSAQFCFQPETEVKGKFAQSCQTLHPQDCSLPGSSVHGIVQARILVWIAVLFSRGSSQPRDQTQVSCIAGRFFTIWATRESPRILE